MSEAQLEKIAPGEIKVSGVLNFDKVVSLLNKSKRYFDDNSSLNFNFNDVEKTDSAGLALLVEWAIMAKKAGVVISFSRVPKQMLDIARVSGLDDLLPIV